MTMKIVGTVTSIPPRMTGLSHRGYHPEVVEIIDGIHKLDDGEWLQVEFADARKAAVRATALRKAGYAAFTRRNFLYAGFLDEESGDDDEVSEE